MGDEKMRIGKFGDVNNISIDTIRHYMDLGLIIPEKRGGQYFFDESSQKDLDDVLELKGLGFSLKEMKLIFLIKNIGRNTDYEQDKYYQSLFMDKYKKIADEIESLVNIQQRLKKKLVAFREKSYGESLTMGVDIQLLQYLKCLTCNGQLTLEDGAIKQNQIIEGTLTCECGGEILIDSGILQVGKTFRPDPDVELTILDYIHATDSTYLENVYRGLEWSKRKINQLELSNKVVLELGSGVGFFLRSIYQELPEDCLYIAVDHNLARHQFLKSALEGTRLKRKILFICADFVNIPIQHQSVDLVIDYTGTSNYSFEHEEFLLQQLDFLMKADSTLLGSYLAFKNFSSKSKIKANVRDNFKVSKIKEEINQLKYMPLDERISELIEKGGKYEDFFVQGEEVFSYSFFGKRRG